MSNERLYTILNHCSSLSLIVPLVSCILNRKNFSKDLKVLFAYIVVSAIVEIFGFFAAHFDFENYFISNAFTLAECTFLAYIYFLKFEAQSTRLKIVIFYAFFAVLAVVKYVLKGGFNKQDNVLSTYEAGFFIVLSIGYFYKLMRELNIPKLKEFYFTWINTAIMFYFGMAFFLFLFSGYIEKRGLSVYNNLYTIHWIVNIAYNLLLALGIWKITRK